jgi:signal transduction histidine kinase
VIKDLEEASTRISHLVGAIKSHVHMDQTNDLQPTDIHTDIENTLTLLGYKLREKNISVKKSFCDNMPNVPAYVGELNQVWTNIIDNAIYALPKDGELTIETTCDAKNARVKIIDNGSGIAPEIISRIFDPFFTTKKVGQGTGIGLDLVKRVITHHNGDVKVNSKPGRTEFAICIPVAEIKKT